LSDKRRSEYIQLAFLASTHFMIHVYTQLLPVLLIPLQEELGISLVEVSLLASIPRLVQVFAYIPTGLVSDRYPSPILTGSFVLTAAGAIIVPLSSGYPMLLVGFGLISLGSTLYHPPSLKLASEFDASRVIMAMGVHNMGSSLGFAAGPLLLGVLMNEYGWRLSYYIWAPITLLVAALSWGYTRNRLVPVEVPEGESLLQGIRSVLTGSFLTVVAMSVMVEGIFNVLMTFIPSYFIIERGMSFSLASIIAGLGPLTGFLGSFAGGLSGDRFGRYKMGALVMFSIALLMIGLPYTDGLWALAAIYAIYRCFASAFMPLMNSMIAAHSNPEKRSLSFSVNFVAVNLFGAIVPPLTSILIDSYGITVIFPVAILGIIPTLGVIYLLRKINSSE